MPIDVELALGPITKEAFSQIDRLVMGCAFDSQNFFGILCDEKVYENDIAERLIVAGIHEVYTQVPLDVRWRTFTKRYVLDLVVEGMVYELKALANLTSADEAQVLNYAALLGLNRIKLVNLGATRVEGRLQTTIFAETNRFDVTSSSDDFEPLTDACVRLSKHLESLLGELGGFLTPVLYAEALASAFGGIDQCKRRLPVFRADKKLGSHPVLLHADNACFLVTALPPNRSDYYSRHLTSIYSKLPTLGLQWINVHHAHAKLVTIKGKSSLT